MFYMTAGAARVRACRPTRPLVLAASLVAIAVALGTNMVGMKIGKWTENIGGASAWMVTLLFVVLATSGVDEAWLRHASHDHPQMGLEHGQPLGHIANGMSGLELAGMMAGEVRDPRAHHPRAGWLASGCVTLFYSAATIALVVLLQPERITEMNGLAEAGDEAARVLQLGWLGPLIALLVVGSGLGQIGGIGTVDVSPAIRRRRRPPVARRVRASSSAMAHPACLDSRAGRGGGFPADRRCRSAIRCAPPTTCWSR